MSHNEPNEINDFNGSESLNDFNGSESLNALDAAAFDAAFTAEDTLMPVFDDAGHIDEGTVHAWLDGAFDAEGAALMDRHVSSCAACGAMVAEARGLLAGSARILGALDGVARGVVPAADASRTASRIASAGPWSGARWWQVAAAAAVVVVGVRVWNGTRDAVPTEAVATEAVKTEAVTTGQAGTTGTTGGGAALAAGMAGDTAALAAKAEVASAPAAAEAPVSAPAASAPATVAARGAVANAAVSADAMDAAAVERRVTVYGTVRDGATLLPIRNARVLASADPAFAAPTVTTMTDSVGRYAIVLPLAKSAAVSVMVRSVAYSVYRTSQLVRGDSLRLEVTLSANVVALSEVVTSNAQDKATVAVSPAPMPFASPSSPSSPPAAVRSPAGAMVGGVLRGVAGGIARGREVAAPARRSMPSDGVRREREPANREQYDRIEDNPFLGVRTNPLSTFSVDVDRAAYGNVRRFLTQGQRPPKDAVRIEELINYFPYELPQPKGADPVSITTDVIAAPWQPKHRLVRIALQSRRIATEALPANNLVFLIDVSGSMQDANKLPLVKQSLRLLVDQLRPQDRVAIVTYAGAAGLVLPSTSGDEKPRIMEAIDRLEAGGSTAGGAGIELAYRTAREHYLANGNNRVILASDGDFNVGVSSDGELERLIEQKRTEGTYLTILGFGMGNYQDAKMEKLAKRGNGNYAYVDELNEARKVLVREMGATLLTVANDVKLQIEFNPAAVQGYRLIGYEDRLLRDEDFNDDRKDAGDMGAGHQVTALYEVVPVGVTGTVTLRDVDGRRYETPTTDARGSRDELLYVKLRYKRPGESQSQLLSKAVSTSAGRGTTDTRFAAAVAAFGMLLRDSEYKGTTSAAQVLEMARAALGEDDGGYRAAFVELVERWRALGRR